MPNLLSYPGGIHIWVKIAINPSESFYWWIARKSWNTLFWPGPSSIKKARHSRTEFVHVHLRTGKQRKSYKGVGNGCGEGVDLGESHSKSLTKGSLFVLPNMPFNKRPFLTCSKLQPRGDCKDRELLCISNSVNLEHLILVLNSARKR